MKKFLVIVMIIIFSLVFLIFFAIVPIVPVKMIECVDYVGGGECKEVKLKTPLLFLIVDRNAIELDIGGN